MSIKRQKRKNRRKKQRRVWAKIISFGETGNRARSCFHPLLTARWKGDNGEQQWNGDARSSCGTPTTKLAMSQSISSYSLVVWFRHPYRPNCSPRSFSRFRQQNSGRNENLTQSFIHLLIANQLSDLWRAAVSCRISMKTIGQIASLCTMSCGIILTYESPQPKIAKFDQNAFLSSQKNPPACIGHFFVPLFSFRSKKWLSSLCASGAKLQPPRKVRFGHR